MLFTGKIKHVLSILVLCLFFTASYSQWWQPNRLHMGVSAGFGGLHEWGKPSFDLHWYRTTLRVAPGLYYFSAGVSQKIAWFKPKERKDRVIIMSVYYMNDYFLSRIKNSAPRRDLNVFMFMPGIHMNLNWLGTLFFEVSGGYMYAREKNFFPETNVKAIRNHHLPMIEVRLGGVILSRKEHHQVIEYPKKKVDKIKSTRLKWKKF